MEFCLLEKTRREVSSNITLEQSLSRQAIFFVAISHS
jgi:hypothetical protein